MSGEIVSFDCFDAMDTTDLLEFDIILGACIGKADIRR
jgi:hypothetical protein